MRRRKRIGLLAGCVFLLASLLFPSFRPVPFPFLPETADPAMPAAPGLLPRHKGPAGPGFLPSAGPSLTDRILGRIDPQSLEPFTGSYTLDELLSRDDATEFRLSSAWLLGGTSAPQLGITVRKDSATDDYSVTGGRVFLPGPGVGLSYEEVGETGESRAFFEIERDF